MNQPVRRFRFGRERRLRGRRQFGAVFAARCRKPVGPVVLCARPNDMPFNRLGLSVPRRVGNAVTRHRIKRLLREAWRLSQHDWPTGYDVVLIIRPHDTATLTEYQRMLSQGMAAIDTHWRKRAERKPSSN